MTTIPELYLARVSSHRCRSTLPSSQGQQRDPPVRDADYEPAAIASSTIVSRIKRSHESLYVDDHVYERFECDCHSTRAMCATTSRDCSETLEDQ